MDNVLDKKQLEKLSKLEQEMEAKRQYEEKNRDRKIASSKRTGIPYDLVDTDVVRIGTMLGLIKSLDVLEGKTKQESFSLLDMFLGSGQDYTPDYSTLPPYFVLASNKVSEQVKISTLTPFIDLECQKYSAFVYDVLRQELNQLQNVICITLPSLTVNFFVMNVTDNIEIVLEELKVDNDEELWIQLSTLRNSLLGAMPICDYKNLVASHIDILARCGKDPALILKHLSYIDANLTLYFGFKTIQPCPLEMYKIYRELVIRTHEKHPELKPFDINAILKHVCIPSIMFVDLKEILKCGIIGPYKNNCVCYAEFTTESFYILKSIHSHVIRVWVLDESLTMFSEKVRVAVLNYCTKVYRTYFYEYTGSNDYVQCNTTIIENLKRAILFTTKPLAFRNFMQAIVKSAGAMIVTDLDAFDDIPTKTNIIPLASSVAVPKTLYDTPFPETL